jgi:hypothetical protein
MAEETTEVKTLYQKLKKIDDLKQHKRKIDQLREVEDFTIRSIFMAAFGKHIDFKMPPGAPPYKPNEEGKLPSHKEFNDIIKRIMNFKDKQYMREKYFIDLLNRVHEDDVQIFVAMKDKTITEVFPSFTRDIMAEAYPKFVKGGDK